jgi:hypothetical protein
MLAWLLAQAQAVLACAQDAKCYGWPRNWEVLRSTNSATTPIANGYHIGELACFLMLNKQD